MGKAIAFLAAALLLLGACSGSAPATAPAAQINATLTDTAIQLDQNSAAAGTVTFTARNSGTVLHSLLLLRTDVPHDKIPADPKDAARVDRAGEMRETAQIPVGGTSGFSIRLAAGNYVLVCNEPGHYLIGMHTPFTVR